jgi:hypothetical protein
MAQNVRKRCRFPENFDVFQVTYLPCCAVRLLHPIKNTLAPFRKQVFLLRDKRHCLMGGIMMFCKHYASFSR